MTVRVLIVDDHPVVREGLRGMLAGEDDLEVVGEAADGAEAVSVAEETRPDVVLMDLRMPGTDGVEATRRLRALGCPPAVLVVTTYDTDHDIIRAVEAGATGYLLKDTPRVELARAVRAASEGMTVLAPTAAAKLLGRGRSAAHLELTRRELEVLSLVAAGRTNAEIGRSLFIGEATVKTHLLHAFAKLGVDDRTAAVTTAIARGLIPAPQA